MDADNSFAAEWSVHMDSERECTARIVDFVIYSNVIYLIGYKDNGDTPVLQRWAVNGVIDWSVNLDTNFEPLRLDTDVNYQTWVVGTSAAGTSNVWSFDAVTGAAEWDDEVPQGAYSVCRDTVTNGGCFVGTSEASETNPSGCNSPSTGPIRRYNSSGAKIAHFGRNGQGTEVLLGGLDSVPLNARTTALLVVGGKLWAGSGGFRTQLCCDVDEIVKPWYGHLARYNFDGTMEVLCANPWEPGGGPGSWSDWALTQYSTVSRLATGNGRLYAGFLQDVDQLTGDAHCTVAEYNPTNGRLIEAWAIETDDALDDFRKGVTGMAATSTVFTVACDQNTLIESDLDLGTPAVVGGVIVPALDGSSDVYAAIVTQLCRDAQPAASATVSACTPGDPCNCSGPTTFGRVNVDCGCAAEDDGVPCTVGLQQEFTGCFANWPATVSMTLDRIGNIGNRQATWRGEFTVDNSADCSPDDPSWASLRVEVEAVYTCPDVDTGSGGGTWLLRYTIFAGVTGVGQLFQFSREADSQTCTGSNGYPQFSVEWPTTDISSTVPDCLDCSNYSGSGDFGGLPPVDTACCVADTPAVLTATFTDDAGDCPSIDGETVTLTYNSGTAKWEGSATICSETFTLAFYCNGGGSSASDFRLDLTTSTCGGSTGISPNGGAACDPLDVGFGIGTSDACGCCTGVAPGYTITITE